MTDRRLRPKPVPFEEQAGAVAEENWFWGNHRGGGGAPLKDTTGKPVTNLKKVMAGEVEIDYSPSAVAAKKYRSRDLYRDEDSDTGGNVGGRGRKSLHANNRLSDDENDYYDNRSNRKGRGNAVPDSIPSPQQRSGALRDMHGGASEREAKQRKEMEYQAQLREQIEEKKRKKEKEKQLEDDEKRRELEEYMASQRRGGKPNPQGAGKGQNRPPIDDDVQEDSRFRNPNKGGKRGKTNPPSDDEDAVDDKYSQRNNNRNNKRESTNGVGKGMQLNLPTKGGGGRGRQVDSEQEDDDNGLDSARMYNKKYAGKGLNLDHNTSYVGHGNGKGGGRSDRRVSEEAYDDDGIDDGHHNKSEKVVPKKEYDELSKLCDKLLNQQSRLESELKEQSAYIKELQRKNGGQGNPSTMLRSKSVQQQRKTKDYAEEDSSSVNRASRRPVSMRERNKQQPPAPVVQKPAPTKDRRAVAFGGSAMDRNPRDMRIPPKDSNPPPATAASGKPKKPVPLEKMFPKKADLKKLTGASIINKSSVHINGQKDVNPIQFNDQNSNHGKKVNFQMSPNSARGGGGGGGGGNGFAKLQQLAKVRGGGPVVVSYESDEGEKNQSSNFRNSNRELRGQSEYIQVRDDDDHIGGDQLDRLLVQARRARS